MTSIAGASILFGFGMTLAMAKKRDPTFFAKGFLSSPVTSSEQTIAKKTAQELHESGSRLAVRALGWGTLYAVSGFSLFSYSVWKLMGVRDVCVTIVSVEFDAICALLVLLNDEENTLNNA